MQQHKGKIVEDAIKRSGFRMKALAKNLGIARNTLYTRLKEADIKEGFIIEIGKIIHYDFTHDFPDIYERNKNTNNHSSPHYKTKESGSKLIHESSNIIKDPDFIKLEALNKKYLKLMEDYNKLLKILILLANNNEVMDIKQDIVAFIKNEEQKELKD